MYELSNHDVYSNRIFHLMHYHLENGRWISNDPNDIEESDDEEEEEE